MNLLCLNPHQKIVRIRRKGVPLEYGSASQKEKRRPSVTKGGPKS